MNLNKVVNSVEEEEKLKNLLGDDSTDNDLDVEIDYIMLPMNKDGNFDLNLLICAIYVSLCPFIYVNLVILFRC